MRIIHQPNRGKSAALTHALREAHSEILVTIDADTSIAPERARKLVRHFADPHVGAVAGNVKVGNRNRWLTRWQALEYITSQNLEKRAFDLLNCIPVVPGALSAWRAEAIARRGRIHRGHGRRRYRPDHRDPPHRLAHRLRRGGHRLDRGAGDRRRADSPALPLDLRHAAIVLEASRHAGAAALRHAGLCGAAEYFSVPAFAAAGFAGDRSAVSGSLALWGWGRFIWRACRSCGPRRTSSAR